MESQTKSYLTVQAPLASGFDARTTAAEVIGGLDLTGKVAIVTGGYSGIGLETSRVLAEAGATVIVPARTPAKAKAAVTGIPRLELETLDLMDPASIDSFARRFIASGRPLHFLINSAGIMAAPLARDARGYESQFATNHLGHFQLTARLWPALQQADQARVISVSSRAHRLGGVDLSDPNFERREYDKWKSYAQSKSANVLFAVALDEKAKAYGVRAFAVHPGLIPSSGIGRFLKTEEVGVKPVKVQPAQEGEKGEPAGNANSDFMKNTEQGAATSVWCAVSEQLAGLGGVYCEDADIAEAVPADSMQGSGVWPWAIDRDAAERLWVLSEQLTGVKFTI
ncbi:SDR family NAD(P)-dependent oxidoreductase [Paenibacillus sonchi]|uniref:SDR family NAD(P)-dependent oxidoreductase n=1 Tax=Paenibacillus sonchi TaxID=373687 RepID=A0A974SCE9_9BACL|nr:SDR family NAD(P)-dependent oxidoreductase [Paenibacillus sonchi]QQZ59155.1 SDR family NAD(P)-dependent oxidoreductase [Paenibacillus sonchi]